MLRESENRFREFVEGTDDLITQVDAQGMFIYVNHTARRIFGLSPEECVGLLAFSFIHPEDRARTECWFTKCQRDFDDFSVSHIRRNLFANPCMV